MTSYRVKVERDADGGAWIADVVDLQGLHTQASTRGALLTRVRELLEDWLGHDVASESIVLVE